MKANKTIIIISILSVLVVVLGGYIVYDKVLKETPTTNNEVSNEQNNQQSTENKNKVTIENIDVEDKVLEQLLDIIGVYPNETEVNNCLNIAVSNNNYKENALDIFSWYTSINNLNTSHYNDEKCQLSEECKRAYSCGGCTSVKKTDAQKILKQYNIKESDATFLKELPMYEDEYSQGTSACCGNHCAKYITHNISAYHFGIQRPSSIEIDDVQTISEYSENGNNYGTIINTKTQTVRYYFYEDGDGIYYLSDVSIN